MTSEQLRTLGFWLAFALVLGVSPLWYWRGVRRQRQRLADWRELCLRLELTPESDDGRVAAGRLQGIDFELRDTGSALLLELPLPRPLLPPGVLLLSARAWRLRPRPWPRPLRLRAPFRPPPDAPGWFMERWRSSGRVEVEAPPAFLEEAHRAAQAYAPLRVEPRRLVRALPGATLPPLSGLRDALRELDATARHWLETVEARGLPTLVSLPLLPSPGALLRGVLARGDLRRWVLVLNAGLPLSVAALLWGGPTAFFGLLMVGLIALLVTLSKREGPRGIVLCLLTLLTTFAAPWYGVRAMTLGTSPSILPVREAPLPEHRRATHFRFHDAVVRTDLGEPGSLTPILPVDWRPGELVTAWAIRPPASPAGGDTVGGVAVQPGRNNGYRWTAINVALEHGLPIHAHTVFLDLSVHPDEAEATLRRQALLLWGLPNALWLGGVLVLWARAVRHSRRVANT